jgi:hypothetical protein
MTLEVSIVDFDEEDSPLNLAKDYSKQTFPLASRIFHCAIQNTYPCL